MATIAQAILAKPYDGPSLPTKRCHWTTGQLDTARRKFILRGWPVAWMLKTLDWINAQPLDPADDSSSEQGIIRSQETMCAQIGCSAKTLYTQLKRLEAIHVLEIVTRHALGCDGLPHRRPNCMIPRPIRSDVPMPVTATTVGPPPPRKSRWLRPQHGTAPISVNLGAVESQFSFLRETNTVSELSPSQLALTLFYERRAKWSATPRKGTVKRS